MNPIALLIVFALGFGAAWSWQGSRADAHVAQIERDRERENGQALATLANNYQGEQERADLIQLEGERRAAALEQTLEETKHELKLATRGRPSLGGAALRVLEHAPGIRVAPAVPAPAGALDGGPGAAAADPADEGEYATDSDVADWIAEVGARYERCRGQLRDIRKFEDGER